MPSSQAASRARSARSRAESCAGAGKAAFTPLTIHKAVDKASPSLFSACASGRHFATVHRQGPALDFMQLADQPKKLVTDYSHGMQKKLAMAAAVIHGPKVLFLDEPFEGVDAIAAGTLKSMLQRMIARGATIFLTSHVLEIVERLCSHVAIIHQGRLVAQGSLEELRAGVEAQPHPESGNGATPSSEKLTLEQIFLRVVGGSHPAEQELSWLG